MPYFNPLDLPTTLGITNIARGPINFPPFVIVETVTRRPRRPQNRPADTIPECLLTTKKNRVAQPSVYDLRHICKLASKRHTPPEPRTRFYGPLGSRWRKEGRHGSESGGARVREYVPRCTVAAHDDLVRIREQHSAPASSSPDPSLSISVGLTCE